MDADIYGPDIPTMFGANEKPRMRDEQVIPVEKHGVKLMSLGFLLEKEQPAIMRGPLIAGILKQFLEQVGVNPGNLAPTLARRRCVSRCTRVVTEFGGSGPAGFGEANEE